LIETEVIETVAGFVLPAIAVVLPVEDAPASAVPVPEPTDPRPVPTPEADAEGFKGGVCADAFGVLFDAAVDVLVNVLLNAPARAASAALAAFAAVVVAADGPEAAPITETPADAPGCAAAASPDSCAMLPAGTTTRLSIGTG
jgi:hypothetical protein